MLEKAFQAGDHSVREDLESYVNDPIYNAIIANMYPAVLEIKQAAHQAIPPVPGVEPKPWEDLSALKLNAVSDATDVPVADWIEANRAGAKPTSAVTTVGPRLPEILKSPVVRFRRRSIS